MDLSMNISNTSNESAFVRHCGADPAFDLGRYIYFYGVSIILPVGFLCNSLSFAVFLSSKRLRKTTTGHYLIALAVADTTFLLGELTRWLNTCVSTGQILGLDFMETHPFWCQTTFFLRYAGKLASAWIIVVIAAERFITVAFPLKVARISTLRIAKVIICFIFVLSICLGAYPFWTLDIVPNRTNTKFCHAVDDDEYGVWFFVVLKIGSLYLPFANIVLFTVLILVFLGRAKKERIQVQQQECSSSSKMDLQLTIMLIGVAIAFLVLSLPYMISYRINTKKEDYWKPLEPWRSYNIYLADRICDMISTSSYALNFFLYCLCGSAFRNRLKALLSCKGEKDRRASAVSTVSVVALSGKGEKDRRTSAVSTVSVVA